MNNFSDFKKKMSRKKIDRICEEFDIENYKVNDDMSISVDGDVDFEASELYKIPLMFKEVSGDFNIGSNDNITSLFGCPEKIGGFFDCSNNKISSLEYGPREVGDFYGCYNNRLKSLKWCASRVGKDFSCSNNLLNSLDHGPKEVGGEYNFSSNNIYSFYGMPDFFEGEVFTNDNPIEEVFTLFNRDPRCVSLIMEFDVIYENRINRDRLEEVYVHMGMEIPKDIKFKNYILL